MRKFPLSVHPHEGKFCMRDPDGWYVIEHGKILTFDTTDAAQKRCDRMNTDPFRYLSPYTLSENGGDFRCVYIWRKGEKHEPYSGTVGSWLSKEENQSGEWLVDGGWGYPPGPWVIAWDEAARAWR